MRKKYRTSRLLHFYLLIGAIVLFGFVGISFAAEPTRFEGVSLTVCGCAGPLADTARKLAPLWEEKTGAKVTVETYDYVTQQDKMLMDVLSGTGSFDVLQVFFTEFPLFMGGGYLQSLDEFIKNPEIVDPNLNLDDYAPAFIEASKSNGKMYVFPYQPNIRMLFYRKDLLEKYGLEYPETLDLFKITAEKLTMDTDGDGRIDAYGYSPQCGLYLHAFWSFLPFFWANGAELFDEAWKPTVNSARALEIMEYWISLVPYSPPGAATFFADEVMQYMLPGNLAMCDEWADHAPRVDDPKESRVVGKVDFGVMPAGRAGHRPVLSYWAVGMNKDSKNKLAAYKFMEWLTSAELVPEYIRVHATPIRTSALTNPLYIKDARWLPAILENYRQSKSVSLIPEYPEIQRVMGLRVNEAWVGKLTPKQALDKAQGELYNLMSRAGYYK